MKNSDNFDLRNWKLNLPIDANGEMLGISYEINDLNGFEHSSYFYSASDGAMVFTAIANGAKTKGTSYARSELREMDGEDRAAWNLQEGGTLTASLVVQEAPKTTSGEDGRIIVGQIHGEDEELVRLYWDNGKLYVKSDSYDGKTSGYTYQFVNAEGEQPNVVLGEKFSYKIDAHGDVLTVEIYTADDVYRMEATIDSEWQQDSFYFKAGAYLGNNTSNGSGLGRVAFYGLDFSHVEGEGLDGLTSISARTDDSGYKADSTGTSASDNLSGGSQGDVIYSYGGNDTVRGFDGNDLIVGAGGDDRLQGQTGSDTLQGGDGNDQLYGAAENDILLGESGNDVLYGGTETDTLKGGDGLDILKGEDGADSIYGDNDVDRVYGGEGDDYLNGGQGNDTLYGGIGNDTIYGLGEDDRIVGDEGADRLIGGDGNDTIYGEEDDDRLYGDAGADKLIGGDGSDTVYAGDGNDILYGDAGADNLYGGTGADVFLFTSLDATTLSATGRDDIYQYSASEGDILNLRYIDANNLVSGNQAFSFIGTGAFTSVAGQLRYETSEADTYVYGDIDGDGASDFSIHIDGVAALRSVDFVL